MFKYINATSLKQYLRSQTGVTAEMIAKHFDISLAQASWMLL